MGVVGEEHERPNQFRPRAFQRTVARFCRPLGPTMASLHPRPHASAAAAATEAARALLEVREPSQNFNARPFGIRNPEMDALLTPPLPSLLLPAQAHDFVLESLLGRGGFGQVYRCRCKQR